jgi:hypothetical protein
MLGGNTNPRALPLHPLLLLLSSVLTPRPLASHFIQLTGHSHLTTPANGPSKGLILSATVFFLPSIVSFKKAL